MKSPAAHLSPLLDSARPSAILASIRARNRQERVALGGLLLLLAAGVALRLWFMTAVRPGLLGYADTHVYVYAAADISDGKWFSYSHQPNGYSMFIAFTHLFAAKLSLVSLAQHALGVATGVLLYLSVRRVGGPPWLGLLPAASVLVGGTQLFAEHAILSESLFSFIVACAIYAAVRASASPAFWWVAAAGLLCGMAPAVRTMGMFLAPAIAIWLLLDRDVRLGRRFLRAGTCLLAAAVVVGGYVGAQRVETGFTGWTQTGMWNLYGRAAPFADCEEFTPPKGTRVLCEKTPPNERPSPSVYVYGGAASPALRAFSGGTASPVPRKEVRSFALAAIRGQPLDYIAAITDDMRRYFDSDYAGSGGLSLENFVETLAVGTHPTPESGIQPQTVDYRPYYPNAGLLEQEGSLEALREFEASTRFQQGPLMIVLVGLALLAPFVAPSGPSRRGALLFTGLSFVLMVTPVATLYYNARFAIPSIAPLVAAAALGAWFAAARIRARGARYRSEARA
jgi:hypothetical protein